MKTEAEYDKNLNTKIGLLNVGNVLLNKGRKLKCL